MIAQCFYAHSTQLLINATQVLWKKEDQEIYATLLAKIKKEYANEYRIPGAKLTSTTQTAYVLALQFNMLSESLRRQSADRFVDNIKDYGKPPYHGVFRYIPSVSRAQ